jgi:hypothetical protein
MTVNPTDDAHAATERMHALRSDASSGRRAKRTLLPSHAATHSATTSTERSLARSTQVARSPRITSVALRESVPV